MINSRRFAAVARLRGTLLSGAIGLALAVLAAIGATLAIAHQTNLTIGQITLDGAEVRYRLHVSAHDLAVVLDIPTDFAAAIPAERFAERRDLLIEYVDELLRVDGDGRSCARTALEIDPRNLPEEVVLHLVYRCAAPPARLRVAYRLFFAVDPGHRALGTIDAGRGPEEYLLDRTAADIEVTSAGAAAGTAAFGRLVRLGVEHILDGLDHVLFVVALLLGGGSFWALVRTVSAFTVAHSLTLALAWFDVLAVPARPVEIAIAVSVAYVAAENALGRGGGNRWLAAFVFGLVHGLGFFGVLRELDIAGSGAAMTLLGFNLGVELGQLAIVAVIYPLVAWAAPRRWYRPAAAGLSLAIVAMALWWVAERAFLA